MRRQGRICALQILYQLDMTHVLVPPPQSNTKLQDVTPLQQAVEAAMAMYWQSFHALDTSVDAENRAFAENLVRGVTRHLQALDTALAAASQHWRVARMAKVDRNLLRLAAFEILYCPDIPRAVSINEAIEIAKRFGGSDTGAFMNGVLDHLAPLSNV